MMKTITAIKQQKKNNQRVNIYLDGEFALGISKIVAAWLKIGQNISDKNIIEWQSQDEFEKAYQKALDFISYRPRSSKESRDRLIKQDFPEIVIEKIINKLHEKQFLDDHTFANEWVENRCAFKPRSRFLLRRELFQKGISEEIIDQVLENIDDLDMAFKAAGEKFRQFAQYDQGKFRKKYLAFLAYRGFPYSISAQVCESLRTKIQKESNTKAINNERISTWKAIQ